jgi:hypothetical protein
VANIQTPTTWVKGQKPAYANDVDVRNMSPDQVEQLTTLLKNAGYYTGPVTSDPAALNGLALLGAIGMFQQSGGYGPTSSVITSDMWYGLNVLSDTVANKRPVTDLGVWNTLTGARALGVSSVPDPNQWSYGVPGGAGVKPGNTAPTPPTTTPNVNPAPAPNTGAADRDAFASMDAILTEYGLGAGSEFDLRDWAHKQATGATYNSDVFKADLMETDAYKQRYGNVNQQRLAKGLSAWTPQQIREFETSAAGIMSRAGGPGNFYDSWRDWQGAIANGWSLAEVQDRADVVSKWTYSLPPEVKQAFAQVTGTAGLQNVWAYAFDPEKAAPLIEHQLNMAEIMGAGSRFNIGVDQEMADTLANLGVTYDRAQQGFQQIDASSGLFSETVGEQTDLTKEGTGVAAVFGTGAGAQQAIEQRRAARQQSVAGGGRFERDQRGITGLASVG